MTKVASLSARILSRKGTAQPMPANTPLIRGGSAAVAIDWQTVASNRAPLTLPAARGARRRSHNADTYRRVEPRVRVSLRLILRGPNRGTGGQTKQDRRCHPNCAFRHT